MATISPSTNAFLCNPATPNHHRPSNPTKRSPPSFPYLPRDTHIGTSPPKPTTTTNNNRRRRSASLSVRAGPPSTTSYIFAFVFPLSLIAVTVISSIRISDSLDERFVEELAMNKAIMEESEADEAEEGAAEEGVEEAKPMVVPTAAVGSVRNRPKRQA
ncbi:hypothetical protein QJS04_geneDACA023766 [Acorus gramineus]|uniref:Uncharacterized protein n=1 Tax=Acorus gramineus TaxID=55184 RepID=A0AAV9BPP4_ACOGR|nr:hypothetical protein QJS04_geneDACA023766 [Acorus gramineus]